jgi:hypothetical protein
MNIYFEREGTKVKASVTADVPNYETRVFSLFCECGGEVYAGLLTEAMQRQISSEIEAIRRDEYESGWRDKAAHKGPRRGWFASTFKWRNRK